jgi:hypothetical protein
LKKIEKNIELGQSNLINAIDNRQWLQSLSLSSISGWLSPARLWMKITILYGQATHKIRGASMDLWFLTFRSTLNVHPRYTFHGDVGDARHWWATPFQRVSLFNFLTINLSLITSGSRSELQNAPGTRGDPRNVFGSAVQWSP